MFGLLGRKLRHSYSPEIHGALGGYDYRLFEVEPDDLAGFIQRRDFTGLNVTIPYKRDVIPFCDELSPGAQAIGSVNTILRRPDGSLYGENTDAAGFERMTQVSGIDVRGRKVLVLGSGGSSLSVRYVLRQLGAGSVSVISRADKDDNYNNLGRHADAQVIVNTTPIGMYPDTEAAPLDLAGFPKLEGVLDIVYNPETTRLLLQARQLGIPCLGGLTMLVGQARSACELFLGKAVGKDKELATLRGLRRKMCNIAIVGMPGSGKTTVGQLLARLLGKKFADSDAALVQSAGMSIPDIFAKEGEQGFRVRETAALRGLGKESGWVIACGGGVVTRPENYFLLRQNGVIVQLERDLNLLARDGRPLSAGNLEEMYRVRLPLYKHFADFAVTNDTSAEGAAQKIIYAMNNL